MKAGCHRRMFRFSLIVLATTISVLSITVCPAFSYTIVDEWIKPGIPDVNKDSFGVGGDNSCAVASTSNLLWASPRLSPEIIKYHLSVARGRGEDMDNR